jgi:hypothetical protein
LAYVRFINDEQENRKLLGVEAILED